MRWTIPLLFASVSVATAQEPPDTNYDESKVPKYELPDPLVCFDGRKVTDAGTWRDVRRPEILRAFATHMYGRTPEIKTHLRFETTGTEAKALDGLAATKEIRIRLFEPDDAPWIDLLLYVPNKTTEPVPVFLGLNYGNQGVHPDPGITPSRNAVCRRGEHAHRWPLELLLKRGYAVASFHGGDIELDRHGSGCRFTTDGWQKGVRYYVLQQDGRTELADDQWGSIGVWAWGLSRALDYLQTDPDIDAKKVAVFGHSRTGKTALWAGAQDKRFGLVISNNSGQGGASLARRRYGESVAASYSLSGIWYCRNYRQYGNNESALPVDAHMLIASIAPRAVYVASAEQDRWADPRGEFLAARHADPVYRLLGRPGLGVAKMPAVNRPVGQSIGYHVRTGDHEITPYDWQRYLDFADRHLRAERRFRAGRSIDGAPRAGYLSASAATVSRNDVLYVTPSLQPWEAMPVGGGDLCAMVRSDGAGLDLHLTKWDAWGFQAPPDAPPGSRFFNNVSPGHVRLQFGDPARAAAAEHFRQRLDLYHGRIVVRFGRHCEGPRLEIWGHPERKILVVEVSDPCGVLEPAKIQLSEWRPSMRLSASGTTIQATEVHQRPAGPDLANTEMEEYFDANNDPLLGRGTAVVLAAGSLKPKTCSAEAKQATMILPQQRPPRYYVVIAAAVTADGDPLSAAHREKDVALAATLATLKAEQQAWWRDYWSRSLLRIQSPDKMADWLCAAYHVHLYTLACVNRGPTPCKWDGGAGLMRRDERTWGLSEWVQEIRFTYASMTSSKTTPPATRRATSAGPIFPLCPNRRPIADWNLMRVFFGVG